ncbi:unnamed protein product [Lactuca saligna]|uniref:Eukaryotic translation initiation factor 5B n=1 Tax=Lactuca saligna TaxID=75948 RepID=A0AA35YVY5_LACSI|nr:unnamed protein product [Lactuca saligna]
MVVSYVLLCATSTMHYDTRCWKAFTNVEYVRNISSVRKQDLEISKAETSKSHRNNAANRHQLHLSHGSLLPLVGPPLLLRRLVAPPPCSLFSFVLFSCCRRQPITLSDLLSRLHKRTIPIITEFKEQGLNTELYSKNKDRGDTYSIVPTSAISGEGIPEMLLLLVQWVQKTMIEKLTYSSDIQCAVLEVKVIEDLGTTIDVVLVNGVLHEGDEIVVCGFQGSIHTTIRSLLTPHLMKELRVKISQID